VKPTVRATKKLGRRHLHSAPLKGVGEEHVDWSTFEEYAKELMESDEFAAGWEPIEDKYWAGKGWLNETGAVGEWRCGNGDGPIDQGRVIFEVNQKMEDVFEYLTSFGKGSGSTLEVVLEDTHGGDGTLNVYSAFTMPWPFAARDFKIMRSQQMNELDAFVIGRSIGDSDAGLKQSAALGRVRGKLSLVAYKLERQGEGRTKITHVAECHLGGMMELDVVARRAAGPRMKAVVDSLTHLGRFDDEDLERGSSIFGSGSRWLRAMSSGVELGGGKKKKKKEERRPSEAIPPPPSGPAPTWDNNIFTNGKALEVEMSSFGFKNPLHEKKTRRISPGR
jgi:hypothetical protein